MKQSELDKYITQFLEYCEIDRNFSQLTLRNYGHYLYRFSEFAREQRVVKPQDISLDLVRRFRLAINRMKSSQGKTLKLVTQNYHTIALRSFLKYLIKRDVKTLAPEKIELAKIPNRTVGFLEAEDVEKLINATGREEDIRIRARDHAILEVLFSTGMRVSELVALRRDYLNQRKPELTVLGKGGKARVVFLSPAAQRAIHAYLAHRTDNAKPLFIRHDRALSPADQITKHAALALTARSVQRLIKKYSLLAGISKRVTPHTIRHSFATDLLINGADIRSVQAMLGHSSITTTQIYTHITNKQLREVHQAFHARRRKK
jgi:site-specific recombinase XerD